MQGVGYLISKEGKLYYDNIFDYDSWEYSEGELQGAERLLKAVSSLMQDKIGIDLFLNAYENIKIDEQKNKYNLLGFADEKLQLAGLNNYNKKEKI